MKRLGSTAITTNSSGVKSGEVRYYPWGTERYTSGTTLTAFGASTPTTYKFTGQRHESSIGLYFYNARWSPGRAPGTGDPSAGRFISADTIIPGAGNPQAYDRYAYVNNDPLRYKDPSGHDYCESSNTRIQKSVKKLTKMEMEKAILVPYRLCRSFTVLL